MTTSNLMEIHAGLCYPRVTQFIWKKLKDFLTKRGVATGKSSPYHSTGNLQVERYNGDVWKALHSFSIKVPQSTDFILRECATRCPTFHSVQSLLTTSTNCTPHKQFLSFNWRSPSGSSLSAWPTAPSPVLLRKFVKVRKNNDLVEVRLIDANPTYANIRYAYGRKGTVSIEDLAPCLDGSLAKKLDISDAKFPEKMKMIDCPDNVELQTPAIVKAFQNLVMLLKFATKKKLFKLQKTLKRYPYAVPHEPHEEFYQCEMAQLLLIRVEECCELHK